MIRYIIRRIIAIVPVMVTVAIFVFLLLRLAPGDPAAVLAGDLARPEDVAKVRAALGLDRSLVEQFVVWCANLIHGDLGVSIISGVPVVDVILPRIVPTLSLAIGTIVIAVMIAVPLGIWAARRQGTWVDEAIMLLAVIGFSVPAFLLSYFLIEIFSMDLKWLPVQGYRSLASGFLPFVERLILPTATLVILYVAFTTRIARESMLNVLHEDYVRTARAKGLWERRVLFRHAFPNAAAPILTVIGTGFTLLLSGVVVIEWVFNIPGLGRLAVDAVLARDYPVLQGIVLLTSLICVSVNLLIDLSYILFDPRIRY